jgi:cell division transport system ATP-binding protein
MIRFDDVWLKYRHNGEASGHSADVVSNMSFDIPDGGFRWLIGASGAGKTSVLKLMYLAEHPYRGRIDILGVHAARISRRDAAMLRRRIGVVYQDFRLLSHLSAYDNVALPMRLARRNETQVRADVTELLRWVGLSGKLDCRPDELSGGEQQRIAIARAVVGRPKLLLADEPTGNLDVATANVVFDELLRLTRDENIAALVATHNPELAARMDRQLALVGGKLV